MPSDEPNHAADTPPAAAPRQGFSPRMLAVSLGSLLALATVAVVMIVFSGERLPAIDQASFDAAQQRWKNNGPASYDIEVAVTDADPAVYRVEVRDGEVQSVTMNGSPLPLRRKQSAWSVVGMFSTVAEDVKHITEPIRVGPNDVNYVTPRGIFDPQFGYPARYRRIEWGSNVDVSWKVTKFEVVE